MRIFGYLSLAFVGHAFGDEWLGINCKGSGRCGEMHLDTLNMTRTLLKEEIRNGNGDRVYNNKDTIACVNGHFCIFYQYGASGSVNETLDYVEQLVHHGCTKCGSVPTNGGEFVGGGELTANYVMNLGFHCTTGDIDAVMCSEEDRKALGGEKAPWED